MIYGSVCSGIECATVAWRPLGWKAAFYSEIEKTCNAVLEHHYPETSNLGDIRNVGKRHGPIELLVGGTPCQSFSVAGLRRGLDDDRGNLAFEYCRALLEIQPSWFVWENVPGTFSSWTGDPDVPDVCGIEPGWEGDDFTETSDFLSILEAFSECGYGWAWRVLDARYFGVPQRRRRIFVVGHLGDWRGAASVLFESPGMPGHFEKGEKKGLETARSLRGQSQSSHREDPETYIPEITEAVTSKWAKGSGGPAGDECQNLISVNARQDPIVSEDSAQPLDVDGTSQAIGIRLANTSSNGVGIQNEKSHAPDGSPDAVLCENHGQEGVYPLDLRNAMRNPDKKDKTNRQGAGIGNAGDPASSLTSVFPPGIVSKMTVRRLTPRECERLQGLPDDYTLVPYNGKLMSDSARYRMIGNGMAVPVMAWIGKRIQMAEKIINKLTQDSAVL